MLLGVLALMMIFSGYVGLYEWMKQFSVHCAGIMLASSALFFIPGTAHHVFCGVMEWFYIRLGRTENARETVLEFFNKTSATMYACYLGLAIFSVALFFMVVTGKTNIPQWCCIFNALPIFLVLTPFHIAGAGNIAGTVMFLGLFLFL